MKPTWQETQALFAANEKENEILRAENQRLRDDYHERTAIREQQWRLRCEIENTRVERRDEIIEALSQRCLTLKAESESFEQRWRDCVALHAEERTLRQALRAAIIGYTKEIADAGSDDIRCYMVAERLLELLAETEPTTTMNERTNS